MNKLLNKSNSYRLSQEVLRNKALKRGVNLIAPENHQTHLLEKT